MRYCGKGHGVRPADGRRSARTPNAVTSPRRGASKRAGRLRSQRGRPKGSCSFGTSELPGGAASSFLLGALGFAVRAISGEIVGELVDVVPATSTGGPSVAGSSFVSVTAARNEISERCRDKTHDPFSIIES